MDSKGLRYADKSIRDLVAVINCRAIDSDMKLIDEETGLFDLAKLVGSPLMLTFFIMITLVIV